MSEALENTPEEKVLVPWVESIKAAKSKFEKIAVQDSHIDYDKESMFAMQAILKNQRVLEAALKNPVSVRNAVINVAAVGLSLNPATKMAYLVPRDGEVCLDISYMGFIKIATDTGSILWAKADIVYQADTFIYNGPSEKPTHAADPFSTERGEKTGCYCIAKTRDGEFLVETMSATEMIDIRAKSKGSDSKYSPWNNFEGEMWKKAVIKRASKTWPKTERSMGRLEEAIQVVNEYDGLQDAYLEHQRDTVDLDAAVDLMKIEETAQRIRDIIDDEDTEEDVRPMLLADIADTLTNDEGIELASRLKLSKPGGATKKSYVSIYLEYLRNYREQVKADRPELENANAVEVL